MITHTPTYVPTATGYAPTTGEKCIAETLNETNRLLAAIATELQNLNKKPVYETHYSPSPPNSGLKG